MSTNNFGRRITLKAILASAVGSAATLAFTPAQASNKASKAIAGYVAKPGPNGAQCSTCVNYTPTDSMCMAVTGVVSPSGYCNFYAPKN
ncbi:MAG TPA: hypothetical protein PK677_03920 [Acidiphilium sp.]|nr:MAG: hypothetical protein B7Z67_07235 [Acidiphilium sp. 21-60-14]OYV91631.1 MAG: hypothetical protein B7Z57_04100 [Acidiphilium sp. 37-60-79]OZB40667.1 MAG: hypothetical protein B7X48_03730 [Acidiphilium sp. 34-60-192]HQT87683.1 hypothetical protein [Acidiphilium sp.]HQU22810.1 hypothetical protein [Acidiphilium sp.]